MTKTGIFLGMHSIDAKMNWYVLELVGKLWFENEVANLRIVNLCKLLIKYVFVLNSLQ